QMATEWRVIVRGRDADRIPTDPSKNAASVAAQAMLVRLAQGGTQQPLMVTIEKGLPMSGGIGGSAASSVAGAYAAALASGAPWTPNDIMLAALEGEAVVSGRHLDNVAPITL